MSPMLLIPARQSARHPLGSDASDRQARDAEPDARPGLTLVVGRNGSGKSS